MLGSKLSKIRSILALSLAALPLVAGCSMMPPIKRAVRDNDVTEVRRLIAAGYDVNASDIFGNALLISCQRQSLETMKALIEGGIDPNHGYKFDSPLAECAKRDRLDMVQYLVEHGAWIRTPEIDAARHNPELYAYLSSAKTINAPRIADARTPGDLEDDALQPQAAGSRRRAGKKPPAFHSDVDEPMEKGARRPDDFALVIGIENYQILPKADFGARDAQTVRKHFEAMGIPPRNIITLEGQAATGNKIKSYIEEWLPLNVKESSTLFIYYSGHGAPDPNSGQAYLVPWDGDPQFLKSTAYPLKKLYSDLSKTKAKHIVVALDACFSGAGGRSVLAKGARPLVTKVDTGLAPETRLTVLAAASSDQITGTLDEQGHGMFTYFFLKGLGEGKSSAKALFDYLNPKVQDEARRQNREQTPALLGPDSPL